MNVKVDSKIIVNPLKKPTLKKRPNFLIIMVDEQRFPPHYEDEAIKEWRKKI